LEIPWDDVWNFFWLIFQNGGQCKMKASSTFSFLAYNLCSFQPILKSEYILEMSSDYSWSFFFLSFQNSDHSNMAPSSIFYFYYWTFAAFKMYSLFKIGWKLHKVYAKNENVLYGAILKQQLKEIWYIISKYFKSIISYLNWLKTAKFIDKKNILDGAILDWPQF
jgi:hypothetical protein